MPNIDFDKIERELAAKRNAVQPPGEEEAEMVDAADEALQDAPPEQPDETLESADDPQPAAPRTPGRPRRKPMSDKRTVQLPSFPASLLGRIRSDIPDAYTNSEAVAAWVYAHMDVKCDVPDEVAALAKGYSPASSEDLLRSMQERQERMERVVTVLNGMVQDQWYMISWLMLERMSKIDSPLLDRLDMSLPAFEDLRQRLRVQIQQAKNAQKIKDGRPIR